MLQSVFGIFHHFPYFFVYLTLKIWSNQWWLYKKSNFPFIKCCQKYTDGYETVVIEIIFSGSKSIYKTLACKMPKYTNYQLCRVFKSIFSWNSRNMTSWKSAKNFNFLGSLATRPGNPDCSSLVQSRKIWPKKFRFGLNWD